MGIFDFIKAAGEALGLGGSAAPKAEDLQKHVSDLGLAGSDLDIHVDGDTVKVSGTAETQEEKEKLIVSLGNVAGIAKVEEDIKTEAAAPAATFYTVQSGDTLSAIAKAQYGDPNAYMKIFEANKPMLSDPDKIYPGQVLRIPAKA